MRIKGKLLGAVLVTAASILALPAVASASGHFYHSGTTEHSGSIPTPTPTVGLTGALGFFTALGGLECPAHAEMELKTTSGRLLELEVTDSECKGFGYLAGCEVIGSEVTELPAFITPTSSSIDLDEIAIHTEYTEIAGGPGCGAEFATINLSIISLTPDSLTRMSAVYLNASMLIEVFGLEIEAEAVGEFEVIGAGAGTYGIEAY